MTRAALLALALLAGCCRHVYHVDAMWTNRADVREARILTPVARVDSGTVHTTGSVRIGGGW